LVLSPHVYGRLKRSDGFVRFPPNGRVQGGVYKISIDLK
jgi:hypothetical protein